MCWHRCIVIAYIAVPLVCLSLSDTRARRKSIKVVCVYHSGSTAHAWSDRPIAGQIIHATSRNEQFMPPHFLHSPSSHRSAKPPQVRQTEHQPHPIHHEKFTPNSRSPILWGSYVIQFLFFCSGNFQLLHAMEHISSVGNLQLQHTALRFLFPNSIWLFVWALLCSR